MNTNTNPNTNPRIKIIGIGDDGLEGLTQSAKDAICHAQVLVGSTRNLQILDALGNKPPRQERLATGSDLSELVRDLSDREGKEIVILTTGDPLFYGVARFLCEKMGKDRFDVVPHVSTMQLAFARIKESWDEAYLANLSSVSLTKVIEKTRTAEKVGLFTSDECSPGQLATALLDQQIDYFVAYVCENLGSPDERVTRAELVDLPRQSFAPLNVVVLVRKPDIPDRPAAMAGQCVFGNADEMFAQTLPKRGLLTSMETRVIALALMDLGPRSIVWDVGAGSGSVSIEAARLASEGSTYAIEMDPDDHGLIKENANKFRVANVVPVLGQAPEAWRDLPDPDAVFVGGTGRYVPKIASAAFERLKPAGRIVVNVGSIQNLSAVHDVLVPMAADVAVRMINISTGTEQLESMRFESRNPTFLVSAHKGSKA